jgi:hypothetical protein
MHTLSPWHQQTRQLNVSPAKSADSWKVSLSERHRIMLCGVGFNDGDAFYSQNVPTNLVRVCWEMICDWILEQAS